MASGNAESILYIYHQKYESSVNDLKTFRESQGFTVTKYQVVPADTYQTIDGIIKTVYANDNALKYCLLFGSVEEVPTYMRPGIFEQRTLLNNIIDKAASDIYYSIFNYNDPTQLVVEANFKVIVGRLTPGDNEFIQGQTTNELTDQEKQTNIQNQVDKIKEYEQIIDSIQNQTYESDLNADWSKKIIGIASNEGDGYGIDDYPDNLFMRKELEKYSNSNLNCHFTELFQSTNNSGHIGNPDAISNQLNEYDDTGEPTSGNLITELEQGSSLMLYAGHANEILLSTTGYDVEYASITDNISKYFLGCVVGCSIGSHDENYMSLSEKWQVLANKGSIAMFVSSVLQSWKPPMYMQRELNDSILKVTSVKSIGDLFKDAVLIPQFQISTNDFWYYHILGDPATRFVLTLPELRTISEPEPEPEPETNSYWQQIGDNMNGVNSGDDFGRSIGMNSEGTRMVIGSPNHNNIGKVDIYDLVNDYWTNVGNEIVGIENGGNFGYSVTMSSNGNRIIVGAYGSNSTKGLVRMYELNDTEPVSWQQMGNDIDGLASYDKFGFSVDMNSLGNRVIIGSPDYDKSSTSQNNGMVAVYEWNNSNWIQIDENIIGKSKTDQFGYSVAMNNQDSRIAIGAPTYGTTNRGAVFLYYLNEQNVWEPVGGLSDIGPIPNEGFISGSIDQEWLGYSLDMSGDGNRIIVGIPLPSSSAGRARVYDFNTNTNQWEQMGNDNQLSGVEVGERFGYSVSISDNGNRIAIGTPQHDRLPGDELGDWPDIGKASIYDWNSSSSQWEQVRSDIQGFEKNDESGTNVLLSDDGSVLAIGAIGGNGNGTVRVLKYKPYGSIVERFILNYIPAGKQDIFSRPTLEWSNVRKDVVKNSISKWNSIIVSLPGSDQERKFVLNLYNVVMSGDVLGTAGPMGLSNNFTNPYYIYYSTSGRVMMNNNIDVSTDDDKTYFQAVLEHEIGHVFGIGTFWFRNNVPNTGILKIAAGDAELAENTTNLILQRQGDSDNNSPLYRTTYDDASFTLITNIYVFFQRDNNNIATSYWFGDIDGTNYYPRDSISFPRLDTNKTYTFIAGEDLSLGSFILENNSGVTITGNPLTTIGTLLTVTFNTPRIETNQLFYSKTDGSWRGELSLDFKQSLYTGASALEVYKFYNAGGDTYKKNDTIETNYSNSTYSGMSNDNIKGIPIEDGNIFLNIGGHLDEGIDVLSLNNTTWCCLAGIVTKVQQRSDFYGNNTETSEIVDYPPLRDELMTGLKSAPSGKKDPLSAITIGLMEDLGYGVDWSKAESYSLNMNVLAPTSVDIQVTKGWNMIGFSVNSEILDPNSLIVENTLFHFDGTKYGNPIALNKIEAHKGYWVKCKNPGTITLNLSDVSDVIYNIPVTAGWNMIGVSTNGKIINTDNLIVENTLYHFNGTQYGDPISFDNLEANKGFWVKCNTSGNIALDLR